MTNIDVELGFAWPFVDHAVWITTRDRHFLEIKLVDTRNNNIVLSQGIVNSWQVSEEIFIAELKAVVEYMVEDAKTERLSDSYLDKYVGTFFGAGA